MFWAVPAFDLQSLCTVDSGLTAGEGPRACRLTQGPSSHLHLECFFFLFPYREKVCSLSELYFDTAGCLVRDRAALSSASSHSPSDALASSHPLVSLWLPAIPGSPVSVSVRVFPSAKQLAAAVTGQESPVHRDHFDLCVFGCRFCFLGIFVTGAD